MKFFKLLALVAALFSIVAISQSCGDDEDPCEVIVCLNNGVCENGACACEAGYEGALCGTLSRAKLIGSYDLAESCDDGTTSTGTASIVADASGDAKATVNIANGASYKITMTGVNSFTVPEQVACTGCDLVENGSGSVESEGVIVMEVVFANTLTCTHTLTPQ